MKNLYTVIKTVEGIGLVLCGTMNDMAIKGEDIDVEKTKRDMEKKILTVKLKTMIRIYQC